MLACTHADTRDQTWESRQPEKECRYSKHYGEHCHAEVFLARRTTDDDQSNNPKHIRAAASDKQPTPMSEFFCKRAGMRTGGVIPASPNKTGKSNNNGRKQPHDDRYRRTHVVVVYL